MRDGVIGDWAGDQGLGDQGLGDQAHLRSGSLIPYYKSLLGDQAHLPNH
jgi:hypothetical protein